MYPTGAASGRLPLLVALVGGLAAGFFCGFFTGGSSGIAEPLLTKVAPPRDDPAQGQIAELQEQIRLKSSQVEQYEAKISSLEAEVRSRGQVIEKLEADVKRLQGAEKK